jgi:hypothetical protein
MKVRLILQIAVGFAVVVLFLVSEAQHYATLMDNDADKLVSYTRSKMHWEKR